MNPRLRQVFSAVFGIDGNLLTDADSPESIAEWDSLTHISLMLAIEAEFGVQFAADDLASLASVALIRERLRAEGADA